MQMCEMAKLLQLLAIAYPKAGFAANEETVQLWFEMLSDLPDLLVVAAVKRMIATNPYPPTIADVRKNAVDAADMAQGNVIGSAEAWGYVSKAMRKHGSYSPGEARASMPPEVWAMVERFGWRDMCMSENIDVIRGQFKSMWEGTEKRRRENAMVPESLRESMAKIGVADLKLLEGEKAWVK